MDVNTKLIEDCQELLPELVSTGLDVVIERNIANGDMEALAQNLHDARNLLGDVSREHFASYDLLVF